VGEPTDHCKKAEDSSDTANSE